MAQKKTENLAGIQNLLTRAAADPTMTVGVNAANRSDIANTDMSESILEAGMVIEFPSDIENVRFDLDMKRKNRNGEPIFARGVLGEVVDGPHKGEGRRNFYGSFKKSVVVYGDDLQPVVENGVVKTVSVLDCSDASGKKFHQSIINAPTLGEVDNILKGKKCNIVEVPGSPVKTARFNNEGVVTGLRTAHVYAYVPA